MSLFKKKDSIENKKTKVKDKERSTEDDCPMCHIPQEVVDQLKNNNCCQDKKDKK